MSMEERLNKVERNQSADAEKIRTLYAANEVVCMELSKATLAMSELKTQIAVLIATLPSQREREDIEQRLTTLELDKAKQQGSLQLGKYIAGAGCALFGFLVANSDKIAEVLKRL